MPSDSPVDTRHFSRVAELLAENEVIPFLGAGANMCDRPDDVAWELGRFAPSGRELAERLAEKSLYPDHDLDLLRVSQYVDAVLGEGRLYRYLHEVFDSNYPPTSLHRLFARLAAFQRERGAAPLLLLTTNYDDLLERAFEDAGESFDVVWYEAKRGPLQGRFLHRPPTGEVVAIERPNEYTGVGLDERPVILKLHGAIDRGDVEDDSYVITEDSYIDYLVGGDVGVQIPFALLNRMGKSHFLFLGYSMHDWNLRVILNRIWGAQRLDLKSWAVQRAPADVGAKEVELALWRARGDVDLLYISLKDYVAGLEGELFSAEPTR
ncbi:MAG TPA: SIR2 family protein [Gaiella sp.]|nr:SIR2 family protein [Gaiella sp.]